MTGGFIHSIRHSLRQLCRQLPLLAGLIALCLLLPALAAPALEQMLTRGEGFRSITIALAGAKGEDALTETLANYLVSMSDVNQYCDIVPMTEEEALEALERGEATAALLLPEGFLESILNGENKSPVVVLDPERALESYLTLWLGEDAADILSTSQAGIYAVLDLYRQSPPEDLTWDGAVLGINLAYINTILSRSRDFQLETLSSTGVLSVGHHYALSLLAYLPLLGAPMLQGLFASRGVLAWHRRLRGVGFPPWLGCLGAECAAALVLLPLYLLPFLVLAPGSAAGAVGPCVACAVWSAAFCAFCGTVCAAPAGSAVLAFLSATVALFVCGGILPPVLLPGPLQAAAPFLPITWVREILSVPLGYDGSPASLAALLGAALALTLGALALFTRRVDREEVTQ